MYLYCGMEGKRDEGWETIIETQWFSTCPLIQLVMTQSHCTSVMIQRNDTITARHTFDSVAFTLGSFFSPDNN